MRYTLLMSTSPKSAPIRTVVLLRSSERKRLEKLAARDLVSSGEILRRGLHAYEEHTSPSEHEALKTLLGEMNTALDRAIASVRSARSEVQDNLKKIAQMREDRA